jgi:glycosyltransferase involved in cell wall biosynthesis
MTESVISVSVVYQIDPTGPVTGGIDSVIRGIVKWAPSGIQINIVGLTTDTTRNPIGRWATVKLAGHDVRFLPVGKYPRSMARRGIPLSLRLAFGVLRYKAMILAESDVLEFHRIEAALLLMGAARGKSAFIHQNMTALSNKQSDIRWRWFPWLYFWLEKRFLYGMDSVFCVSSVAALSYQERYRDVANRFRFLPTWMDTDYFFGPTVDCRQAAKAAMAEEFGFAVGARILMAVGRLDTQKNPLLMLEAFAKVASELPDAILILIGTGVMRVAVEMAIVDHELSNKVFLAGLRDPESVATMLAGADLYVMSSAYEGMPISVLEALACGVPVVSTRVGEVERVVRPGVNGALVEEHQSLDLASAILDVLTQPRDVLSRGAISAVEEFIPERVLQDVYAAYRRAATRSDRGRSGLNDHGDV